MATFARSTFSHAAYASFRPTYPPALFNTILTYCSQTRLPPSPPIPPGILLDLGCGHGLISRALAPHFTSVLALDPSAGMVSQAQCLTPPEQYPNIKIRQGAAENLRPFIPSPASIDCVVAGQAAHWFDYSRTWPELARVVRSGGTLAFWGYKDHVIVGRARIAGIFDRFIYSEEEPVPGMESMGRFWEKGRDILKNSLREIVPPEEEWTDVRRIVWDPDRETGEIGRDVPEEVLWMRRTLRLGELESYIRTFSAFGNWKEAHPELKSKAERGEGDVIDRLFDEVVDAVPEWKKEGDSWREIEVEVVWGTVTLLARRR